MEYRNKKTGLTIVTPCTIKGGDWEPVEAPKTAKSEAKEPETKTKGKKVK